MVGNDADRNRKVASVKTNDLKKGARVKLRNGWWATLTNNKRGNVREARVEGHVTETGDVYAHDIMYVDNPDGTFTAIEHTPAQLKLKAWADSFFS